MFCAIKRYVGPTVRAFNKLLQRPYQVGNQRYGSGLSLNNVVVVSTTLVLAPIASVLAYSILLQAASYELVGINAAGGFGSSGKLRVQIQRTQADNYQPHFIASNKK